LLFAHRGFLWERVIISLPSESAIPGPSQGYLIKQHPTTEQEYLREMAQAETICPVNPNYQDEKKLDKEERKLLRKYRKDNGIT